MADSTISNLPASTGVDPTNDVLPIVHNGVTEKVTLNQLISGMGLATDAELAAGLALKADTSTINAALALKADAIKTGSNGFMVNSQIVSKSYDVPVGYNTLAVGPITLAPGVVYNLPAGSRSIIL